MMRPCEKCFENNWGFEFHRDATVENAPDMITATCKGCGYEVQFPARKKNPRRDFRFPPKDKNRPSPTPQSPLASRWRSDDLGEGNRQEDVPWA